VIKAMGDLLYNTDHVAALHGVTIQTVRAWSMEFEKYLSPYANPGARRQRLFTPDDMAVFDLIAQLKGQGRNFQEIHEALASGQRGGSPETPPSELEALIADNSHTELVAQNNALVRRVEALQAEIEELRRYRDENIALKARLDTMEGQLTKEREIGRLEGELEALKRQLK
jgi:DNA-binding transcriptional MerR regulator